MTSPRHHWARPFLAGVGVYWVALAVGTHLPAGQVPPTGMSDKSLHFLAYLLLAVGWLTTLRLYRTRPIRRWWLTPALLLSYAALDELTQPLVGRTCDLLDWLADGLGVLLAVGGDMLLHAVQHRRFSR